MTDNECRRRIREASTARLRILDDSAAASTCFDVTYSVDGNTVVLRRSDDSRSDVLDSRRSALLEIDHGTLDTRTGWRIVITGLCEPTVPHLDRPAITSADDQAEVIELQIEFLEGRHGAAHALPSGSMLPRLRREND